MILLILGILLGLGIAIFLVLLEAREEPRVLEKIERFARPSGAVILPPEDSERTRGEILEKNKAKGRDTPVSDLV